MFTDAQKSALASPLDRSKVAQRKQGGGNVSYVEGWHCIAEANRIFGFDAWTRETTELRQLGEPRELDGKVRVDYMARVRIVVQTPDGIFPVVREGCGFGQGIDRDRGQAHESALKEAETDAMKRALMTFGNPFGLALYDKTQSNVAELPPALIGDEQRHELIGLVEASGADLTAMLKYFGIADLREIPAGRFEEARRMLQTKLKQKGKANG